MSGLKWNPTAAASVSEAAQEAVGAAADHILEEANRTVPLQEGTLQRSGKVTRDGDQAVVSYDTPYAVRQHEDTRLRHDDGRRAKWLQLTLQERQTAVLGWMAAVIRGAAS